MRRRRQLPPRKTTGLRRQLEEQRRLFKMLEEANATLQTELRTLREEARPKYWYVVINNLISGERGFAFDSEASATMVMSEIIARKAHHKRRIIIAHRSGTDFMLLDGVVSVKVAHDWHPLNPRYY